MSENLVSAAEEAVEEKLASERAFEPSNPESFPAPPKDRSEEIRLRMRDQALRSHYFFAKTVLGYTKLRVHPHGELCAFLDFLENARDKGDYSNNRSVVYMPRDTYKTTIATISRAVKRGCKDPDSRGLILADTGLNAIRFGTEIGNHFKSNALLQWLFPEVIPDNFNTVVWSKTEMVLRRTQPWREPTFDMMGAGSGIESRHYDWILADDLVTETHIHSDAEMDRLIAWLPGLESLLVSDVESPIDFVGSRKKKGDAYEFVEKYYGASNSEPHPIGPHAEKRGSLCVYSRSIYEDGELIFPYDPEKKSGISKEYVERVRLHDPERYHAQLANSPKGSGLNFFRLQDLRYFSFDPKSGIITASHGGKEIERVSIWSMQRLVLYDPSVAEKRSSSKQALWIVAKGSGPNRYVLGGFVGHILPDEMMEKLFWIDEKFRPEFFSIEKRGFQGWVKYSLEMLSELKGVRSLSVLEYPPIGSVRAQWSKTEHIRSLQPIISNNLLWLPKNPEEEFRTAVDGLRESIEFYPNVRWDDDLDALGQGVEWWPFSVDEAEVARRKENEAAMLQSTLPERFQRMMLETGARVRSFDEEEFLRQIDPTGYGIRQPFNN